MISMWTLYWLNIVFSVKEFLPLPIVSGMLLLILGVIFKGLDEDLAAVIDKITKPFIVILCVCITLALLIPSKKEAIAIYMIPKIVNNEQISQLPENAAKYLNVLFKKEMAEIQGEALNVDKK